MCEESRSSSDIFIHRFKNWLSVAIEKNCRNSCRKTRRSILHNTITPLTKTFEKQSDRSFFKFAFFLIHAMHRCLTKFYWESEL